MCSVTMRQKVEKEIVRSAIVELTTAGFFLKVYDGEDFVTPVPTNNVDEIFASMFTTDEDSLLVFSHPTNTESRIGWISFIYGNEGWDVIHDYTVNLEAHLKTTNKLADSYS